MKLYNLPTVKFLMTQQHTVKLIKYGGIEYQQACQLRYQLFFAEHNLAWSTVYQDLNLNSFYAAITGFGSVIAYGELAPHPSLIYRIRQMVVKPSHQRQNLGSQVLKFLIAIARQEGATSLILDSRLTAVGFYQRLGFNISGREFPSETTGVLHISMSLKL